MYDDTAVVALATFVAASDLLFILIAVPESLPERVRPASWGAPISWEQADPFSVSILDRHSIIFFNLCINKGLFFNETVVPYGLGGETQKFGIK